MALVSNRRLAPRGVLAEDALGIETGPSECEKLGRKQARNIRAPVESCFHHDQIKARIANAGGFAPLQSTQK